MRIYKKFTEIREHYALVRGAWGTRHATAGEEYDRTGFKLGNGLEPDNYDEDKCEGACALGMLDIHLGAFRVNQQMHHFSYKPVDWSNEDDIHEWFHHLIVVAGKKIASELFNEWKWTLSTEVSEEIIEMWADNIASFNDSQEVKREHVDDFLDLCLEWTPYRDLHALSIQFRNKWHYSQNVHMARGFYNSHFRPYLDAMLLEVHDVDDTAVLRLLREANIV